MKILFNKLHFVILIFMSLAFVACEDEDYSVGEITTPSNIQVDVQLVGQDAEHPNGDGSGQVIVNVTAENALYYRILMHDGEEIVANNGTANLIFTENGVNTYPLTAVAYGTGGVSSTLDFDVEVFAEYIPPPELVNKLYGDGSRTWRIKAEKQGHFGLGPVGGSVPCEWYGAGPYDKADTGMYDDRFIFNEDETFTHITNGTIFGRVGLVEEVASGGEIDGADVYNAVLDDYESTHQLIIGEVIKLAGTSFMGYYTGGNHQYQIFDRSVEGEMTLRTTDGNGEFDWWFIITYEDVPEEE